MIDGLKLTVTGKELRTLLEQRMDDHLRRADRWKREQARAPPRGADRRRTPAAGTHLRE